MSASSSLRPVPRPGVMAIDLYVPGKSGAPGHARIHKLSSNETPLGPSPAAVAAMREATHPAGTPVFVVAKPLDDPAAAQRDWVLFSIRCGAWSAQAERALQGLYGEVVARAKPKAEAERLLLAVPGGVGPRQLQDALDGEGAGVSSLDETGSHAARFRV